MVRVLERLMADGASPAVFVDRDGTVIEERHYLSDAEEVALVPGAADALRRLGNAGFPVVMVTNQSGIARGYFGDAEYRRVEQEVRSQLARQGVDLLAVYHCPHHPDFTGACDCRKPAPGLFTRAAREHDLDLRRSVYIGDRLRDIEPGLELRGLAILVRTGHGEQEVERAPEGVRVAADILEAAEIALEATRRVDTDPPDR